MLYRKVSIDTGEGSGMLSFSLLVSMNPFRDPKLFITSLYEPMHAESDMMREKCGGRGACGQQGASRCFLGIYSSFFNLPNNVLQQNIGLFLFENVQKLPS